MFGSAEGLAVAAKMREICRAGRGLKAAQVGLQGVAPPLQVPNRVSRVLDAAVYQESEAGSRGQTKGKC